jgi:hypothetical protein
MPKYTVLDKDTIKNEIMPNLSVAKRGFVSQGCLIEVVNAILYKLRSGCQWHQLPVLLPVFQIYLLPVISFLRTDVFIR